MNARADHRVLFVDDEIHVLDGLRRMMHAMRDSWTAHFATSGNEALELMEASHFDVIVADLQMPGMSGPELLAAAANRHPATARFALSGYSDSQSILGAAALSHRFFGKPCRPLRLRSALGDVLRVRQELGAREALERLVMGATLPLLPGTLQRAASAAATAEARDVLIGDPALAARVLQFANWDFFRPRQREPVVELGAHALGAGLLRLLMDANILRSFEPAPDGPFRLGEFARHSRATARIASQIACLLSPEETAAPEGAAAGVLHDVGKLVFLSGYPADYGRLLDEHKATGASLCQLEADAFGTDHAAVGSALLLLWGLPAQIARAVACHHQAVSPEEDPLAASVRIANELDHRTELGIDGAAKAPIAEPGLAGLIDEWSDRLEAAAAGGVA